MRLRISIIQIFVRLLQIQRSILKNFKNRSINKKQKGVRRDTAGMNFGGYTKRINTLRNIDCKLAQKKLVQKR